MEDRFWETKTLAEMSPEEWEALCDGCGRCCMVILRDEDTNDIWETDVACRLFDPETRRCGDYVNRLQRVPDCVQVTPANAPLLTWMPDTCAYRLRANGERLFSWHPLISGDPNSVAHAGKAVSRDLVSETSVDVATLEDRVTCRRCRD